MKHSQIKTIWRRLIAALLISGVVPFLGLARNQLGQKVPTGFNYPQAQETIQVEAEIESRSLSGLVTDPSGAAASRVLVEKVRPGWRKRTNAVFSDTEGHFAFAGAGPGTHFLRISKPGFNTILLKVKVTAKAKTTLQIDLHPSN
ncbi:MAG TPA: carboxypeptidase-like regulatory domain-containing protein [Pyrinomonadaceae bacterium]|nr:carboxypeptidase-like regulatory domain-containing protein [Pyrinomonadaceae bacterium]